MYLFLLILWLRRRAQWALHGHRVPWMYRQTGFRELFEFLGFRRINNLFVFRARCPVDSVPGHHISIQKSICNRSRWRSPLPSKRSLAIRRSASFGAIYRQEPYLLDEQLWLRCWNRGLTFLNQIGSEPNRARRACGRSDLAGKAPQNRLTENTSDCGLFVFYASQPPDARRMGWPHANQLISTWLTSS